MKPNYKNWVPKGMIIEFLAGFVVCLLLALWFGLGNLLNGSAWKIVLTVVFAVGVLICLVVAIWSWMMYRAFSYDGKRQMSRQIIDSVAQYVTLPEGGRGLDVGCGSGALTIAVAKRFPKASMVGVDRWGVDYASYSKHLCEDNARAEGVSNTSFAKGNALKLDFEDESFDAVTSNYVYHNIPSRDRQAILLETLRVLKKGGCFVLHDIYTRANYGDMQKFIQRLKEMGYEQVELIDTTNGKLMTKHEALWMSLKGSAILFGKK